MSENEIKPVAWVERNENGHDRMWSSSLESWANRPADPEPLYDQSAIDRLTAERDAAVADAERWQELCRQIDAGTFPSIVIDDAMAMGAGALELQVDAARAHEDQA